MPDSNFETVSSTHVSALFDRSPYTNTWILYHSFRKRHRFQSESNERMELGMALQPAILGLVAKRYNLDIQEAIGDEYHRKGPLGCSLDGLVRDPNLGVGIVEAKNVDWQIYKDTWAFKEGSSKAVAAPAHIELQLQVEMYCMDAQWGAIAALVGGNELIYLPRKPDDEAVAACLSRAKSFLEDVAAERKPPMPGTHPERAMQVLNYLYPVVDAKPPYELVNEDNERALELDEIVDEWELAKGEESAWRKRKEAAKVQLLGITEDHGFTMAATHNIYVNKTIVEPISVSLPVEVKDALAEFLGVVEGRIAPELSPEGMDRLRVIAEHGGIVTRKGFTKTNINAREVRR